jgi:ubiquinone/menaquinone biosynthesis C-methylase UbiE
VEHFDPYADSYGESVQRSIDFCGQELEYFTRRKTEHLLDVTRRHLGDAKNLDFLDVGCGVGVTDAFLADRVGTLHGVDVAGEAIARAAERNPTVAYQSSDGVALPYHDEFVDVAFAICVMHHVALPERSAFVSEMRRVVRSGGLVVVFEHNPFNPLTRAAVNRCVFDEGVVLLRRRSVEAHLAAAGLALLESRYIIFTTSQRPGLIACERRLGRVPFGAQHYVVARRVS